MTWPTKTDFVDGDVLTAAQVNNIGTNLNLFDPTSATSGQVPVADGAGSVSFATPSGGATQIMVPTAAVVGAGTATINPNGSVTFTTVTSLALEGVFTSAFANYFIVMTVENSTSTTSIQFRLRSGSTNTTATEYFYQYLKSNSSTVSSGWTTSQAVYETITIPASAGPYNEVNLYVYEPQVATRTKFQTFAGGVDSSNFQTRYTAGYYRNSSSFDGIAWTNIVGSLTGKVTVYGLKD